MSHLARSVLGVCLLAPAALASDPFADAVVSYEPGVLINDGFHQSHTALGSPERHTGEGSWPGAVTPFNPAFGVDEIVGIGAGGWLTVRFDEPVANDPLNPYGIDLLIFGNTGYQSDLGYGETSGALFGHSGAGQVEVSQDGVSWFTITGVRPDNLFPTLGYLDTSDPFTAPVGQALTDFTRPVDPGFDAAGMTLAQIIASYDGSGGGAGIDLGSVGLSWITHVRISNTAASGEVHIDALSDVSAVPAPGGLIMVLAAAGLATRRRSGSPK